MVYNRICLICKNYEDCKRAGKLIIHQNSLGDIPTCYCEDNVDLKDYVKEEFIFKAPPKTTSKTYATVENNIIVDLCSSKISML